MEKKWREENARIMAQFPTTGVYPEPVMLPSTEPGTPPTAPAEPATAVVEEPTLPLDLPRRDLP